MLTVARVDLPDQVTQRLRERAALSASWGEFLKERLIGFKQPVARATAFVGPLLVAFVYAVSDFFTMVEVASVFAATSALFIFVAWYMNRHDIRSAYSRQMVARRAAKADLKAGQGEAVDLTLRVRPVFYEHEHGVIVLADSGNGQALYFDVDSAGEDSRWFLYVNGDMHRDSWRWLKLLGSGAVMEFEARGRRLAGIGDTPYVEAPDAWEAISLALGEPQDGDVIDMPFEEVVQTISRLL